jgi:ankyrin repeat protein
MYAAKNGHLEIAKLLIDKSADVNAKYYDHFRFEVTVIILLYISYIAIAHFSVIVNI